MPETQPDSDGHPRSRHAADAQSGESGESGERGERGERGYRELFKTPNRRPMPGSPVVEDAVNPSLEASWRHPWRHRPPSRGIPGINRRFLEAPYSSQSSQSGQSGQSSQSGQSGQSSQSGQSGQSSQSGQSGQSSHSRPEPAVDIHAQRILILDFGSQYTQLIARRVRENGVYCEILPYDSDPQRLHDFAPRGVIISGGPESVTAADAPRIPEQILSMGVPLLGICYGMQALSVELGGQVEPAESKEFGYARACVHGHSRLLANIEDHADSEGLAWLDVWMSHGDRVLEPPRGFKVIASTSTSPVTGMGDDERGWYGIQFHPEVTHTPQGARILARFVGDICGCRGDWTPSNIIEDSVSRIRERVGGQRVVLGLSGGVDSSVTAALLHEAIGDQLTCVFVDNGLLRWGEAEQVVATFSRHMGVNVLHIDAEQRFLDALCGVEDPEQKRRIIGRLFVEIFDEQAAKLEGVAFLAQGTIYPDVVESAGSSGGKAHVIKSHHNVGGLPEQMQLELVEPLRELFKDEVRRIGLELGLPADMIHRHPFPGPGLGVRILGEVRKEYADLLRRADAIFIHELEQAGWYERTSQAFAVFLPVRSVGVTGDGRRYEHVIALRAVETVDFMTARWAHLPYDFLDHVSRRIINEIEGISRVVYDISGKPPATIEWE